MTYATLWALWVLSLPVAAKFISKWYGKLENGFDLALYVSVIAVWPMFLLLNMYGLVYKWQRERGGLRLYDQLQFNKEIGNEATE